MSRELILSMTVSADGFTAGPNGEFDWAFPAMSDEGRARVAEFFWTTGLIALGRKSYHAMSDFWPTNPGSIAAPMNEIPKAVFSQSGAFTPPAMEKTTAAAEDSTDPEIAERIQAALESWKKPIVAGADLIADIQRLKQEDGKPICAIGGSSFGSSLIAAHLVDVFRISVHPVALGRGLPLFGGLECPMRLKLEDLSQSKTGVVVKTYRAL